MNFALSLMLGSGNAAHTAPAPSTAGQPVGLLLLITKAS